MRYMPNLEFNLGDETTYYGKYVGPTVKIPNWVLIYKSNKLYFFDLGKYYYVPFDNDCLNLFRKNLFINIIKNGGGYRENRGYVFDYSKFEWKILTLIKENKYRIIK